MKHGACRRWLNVLTEDELHQIHSASLKLLEDPGIWCESDLILDILGRAGANTSLKTRMIRVPPDMVEAALRTALKSFTLHGRNPEANLQIEPGRVYFGMGGTSEPYSWDHHLGRYRSPTKADMVLNTRVAEALPNVDFVMTLCSSRDMPTEQVFFHDYDAIFRNTTKPVVVSVVGRQHTARILEMAAAVSGGEAGLREKPWVMAYVTPMSPLAFTRVNEGILEAAAFGVPILYSAGPMMGANAPATLAGTLAQANAEVLFGLVLSQLVKPGIPFVHAAQTAAMDMVTGQCTYGSAEQALGRVAAAQLAGFYGLPSFNTGGGVEAKLPDAQAAAEATMGMLLNGLAGVTTTQCMGTLASGLYGSAEMLVICDEIAHMVKHVLRGIAINDDTLALDVIREVGARGQFLGHEHTVRHFRQELFFPMLFGRQSVEQWVDRGARSMADVAHSKVEEILSQAGPVSLLDGAEEGLRRSLQSAIEGAAGAEAAT